ncbi:TPA: hypothetical protein QFF48_001634 [Enterococcus faecium]
MEIIFTKSHNMALPSKRVTLYEGNQQLLICNQELLRNQEQGECTFELYLEKQEIPTYEDTWVFPSAGFDFIHSIEKQLVEDEMTPEMQQFLTLLEKEINQPLKKWRAKKRVKREDFLRVSILIICLVIGSYFFLMMQTKIADFETDIQAIERRLDTKDQVDIFSRYFLTNFYSYETEEEAYKEKNHLFLDEKLLEDLSVPSQQVVNILTWSLHFVKDEWTVTYIVTFDNPEEERETKKLHFNVKEVGSEAYQVVSLPRVEEFNLNRK